MNQPQPSIPSPNSNDLERQSASEIREAILEGYRDAIAGRLHQYEGDLRKLMAKVSSAKSPEKDRLV
ncbi:hypothetical protein [Anatilimnocola floriformis]|uniref:hypothetical protein n=1 Tax=Anatilimnocola floriformis TaxID=2948575 RepID=UPI0020C54CC6|nr:hypothetical protein [Anatilimnocola floriformis]